MSQENQITMRGYLTAEPKLIQKTSQAVPLTEIRVGCTPRRLNHETGEWYDLPTSYYRVKCWRRLAINAAGSLHKGDQVFIRGRFYMNSWTDNQQRPRSTLEIEADTIGHDLSYGWSHFIRGSRPSANSTGVNEGEAARQEAEAPDVPAVDGDYPSDLDGSGAGAPEPGEGAGAGVSAGAGVPDIPDDASSLERELEPEAIPF